MMDSSIKPRLLRFRYFIWVIIPVTVFFASRELGTPQFRWSYSWIDQGQGSDPSAHRHYTRCTYIGAAGETTIHPLNGRCTWVRFQKRDKAAQ